MRQYVSCEISIFTPSKTSVLISVLLLITKDVHLLLNEMSTDLSLYVVMFTGVTDMEQAVRRIPFRSD